MTSKAYRFYPVRLLFVLFLKQRLFEIFQEAANKITGA